MPRSGPRPNSWKVKGEIPHQQHIAWHRMRAQAIYRGEAWDLPFEDFQTLWRDHWHERGRDVSNYCLTRIDDQQAWSLNNCQCVLRIDHLRRHRQRQTQGYYNKE